MARVTAVKVKVVELTVAVATWGIVKARMEATELVGAAKAADIDL